MKNYLKFAFVLLILTSIGFSENIIITSSVDREEISLNDILTYRIDIEGTKNINHVPEPTGKNFKIVQGPSQSSNIQIINGAMEIRKSFTWQIIPIKPGELIIDGFSALLKKKKYSTQAIKVKVVIAGTNSVDINSNLTKKTASIFLEAVPSKKNVFIGEQIVVKYNLYFRNNIRNYSRNVPNGIGFWIEEFPAKSNPHVYEKIINGIKYHVAEIQRLAFFPTKTGKLIIDPMITECEVEVTQKRKRRSSADSFFDDPFFGNSIFNRTKVERVISNPIEIEVKSIPAFDQSDTLPGVLTNVSIKALIDTLEITQNKALTLKYILSGTGNINSISLDEPNLSESVEIFPPKTKKLINNKGTSIKGTSEYEYVIIPHEPGILKIPSMTLNYFDPDKGRYRVLKSNSFEVKVNPDKKKITSASGLRKEEIALLDQDIRFIYKESGKWRNIEKSLFTEFWFIVINTLSILLIFGALGISIHAKKIGSDYNLSRKKQAWKMALEKLNKGKVAQENSDKNDALTNFYNSIEGYISDKTNMPKSGNGVDDINLKLIEKNIDPEIIKNVSNILEKLEHARFAPGAFPDSEYSTLFDNCKKIINQLNKVL